MNYTGLAWITSTLSPERDPSTRVRLSRCNFETSQLSNEANYFRTNFKQICIYIQVNLALNSVKYHFRTEAPRLHETEQDSQSVDQVPVYVTTVAGLHLDLSRSEIKFLPNPPKRVHELLRNFYTPFVRLTATHLAALTTHPFPRQRVARDSAEMTNESCLEAREGNAAPRNRFRRSHGGRVSWQGTRGC